MHWRVKGVLQKALSHVPCGVRANDLLRHLVGGDRRLVREIRTKIEADWLVLVGHMHKLGMPVAGHDFLEIGTGWYPTLPVCYALAGARRCHTFDLSRHLDERMSFRMVEALADHLPSIARAGGRDPSAVQAELGLLSACTDLAALLAAARIDYHAPADASRTGLAPASIDVVFSNSVLEHIPREAIRRIMAESHRVLRPGGVAIHSVNCGDHYAYFDRAITPVNYLAYTEREWARWNNDIQYQNRLRAGDFLALAEDAGFEIAIREHHAKPHLLELVGRMKIAPEFRHYPPEQLACTSIDFVARKRA